MHRCRFLNSDEATRNTMFKLIPHIANGSWVIRQSVGSTPVIIGKVGAGGRRGTARVARGTASGICMVSLGRRRGGGRRGLAQSAPVITVGLGDSSNQMGYGMSKLQKQCAWGSVRSCT